MPSEQFELWNKNRNRHFTMRIYDQIRDEWKTADFYLDLDTDSVRLQVKKAVRNKSKRSIDGPIEINIVGGGLQ